MMIIKFLIYVSCEACFFEIWTQVQIARVEARNRMQDERRCNDPFACQLSRAAARNEEGIRLGEETQTMRKAELEQD